MTAKRGARSARARRAGGEAGSVVTETLVAFPALLLLLLGIFQFAMWFLGSQVALGAAREGARAARVHTGTADAGRSAALGFMAQGGNGWVVDPRVRVDRGPDTVLVAVQGRAFQLVPGLTLTISQSAGGPVERFRPPEEG